MTIKAAIEASLERLIHDYCTANGIDPLWRKPLVRYGDARPAHTGILPTLVPGHFMPEEFLPGATTLVSYFLPFREEIPHSNVDGDMASEAWASAYLRTNTMAAHINPQLAEAIRAMGFRAAVPENIGFSTETLMSRWSQRHIAWLCGHGTFGINNMLIGDEGCCGRYFSIVGDIPVAADPVRTRERCLYKARGICGVCVKRCKAGALSAEGFDRRKCWDVCLENEKLYPEAQVCGKCDVGLPCSFRDPTAARQA